MSLTRAKFEQLCDPLFERCRGPVQQAMKDAHMNFNEIDEVVLVGGSTRIPKVQEIVKQMFGKEPHKGVNPDEVVAVGAAIQGGVLAGEVKDILLLDVTPLSLGIETLGGIMTKLVERNTTIPAERKNVFSTADDNQSAVTVKVFQGERPMAADNRLLGQFNLEGLPPAPRGVPQIEVKFDIDANGILHVSAKDLGTGKEQKVRHRAERRPLGRRDRAPPPEADSHADEDKKKRQLAESRNQADSMCWQLDKLLQEHDAKLSGPDKEAVKKAIEKTREAAKGEDVDALKAEALIAALFLALHSALYLHFPGADGAFQPITNFGAVLDRFLMGHNYAETFAVNLNILAEVPNVLAGIWVGNLLRSQFSFRRKLALMLAGVAASIALGMLISPIVPINKWLWTASYALVMLGWTLLGFVIFFVLDSGFGFKRPFRFLVIIGMNSLLVYCIGEMLGTRLRHLISLGSSWASPLGELLPILQATLAFSLIYLVTWWLDRKKIYLRA